MLSLTKSQKALLLAGLFIAGYFCYEVRLSLRAKFTHDDLMNCALAVREPLSLLVAGCIVFFRFPETYRPLPELVYRAAYSVSGLNLLPLRIFLFAIMGLNIYLAYCFARRLTLSREAAVLTALLSSYHLKLAAYYFNTGMIYDILCFFCYFSAVVYYLRIRQAGRMLRWYELLVFCGLYALALDCKELAVSLPVLIGAYELLFNPPPPRLAAMLQWSYHELAPVWITALMTAAYIKFRVMAPGAVSTTPGYEITLSFTTYLERMGHYLNELFYAESYFDARRTLAVLLILLFGAILARSRKLALCWLMYVIGVLPMASIYPRGLTAVWIPTAGLLVYTAVAAVSLRDAMLWLLRRTSWQPAAQVALFVLAACFMLKAHPDSRFMYQAWMPEYNGIEDVRVALLQLCPTVPKGSKMLFVTDPLNGSYSTVFLVQLLYHDFTGQVDQLFRFDKKPDAQTLAKYDYVFDFVNGKLVRLDPAEYARKASGT